MPVPARPRPSPPVPVRPFGLFFFPEMAIMMTKVQKET
jgi:hypothetical protein